MTAFDTAWGLLKTDMRLPNPLGGRPSWTDPHANLAFHGSRIPDFRAFEAGDNPPTRPHEVAEWYKQELERRAGRRINAPVVEYDVGDFTENVKDGIEDKSYRYGSDEPRMLKPSTQMGTEVLMGELERASLINALNDAGIFDEQSLANITDQAFRYMDAGDFDSDRMKNDKGMYMRRIRH